MSRRASHLPCLPCRVVVERVVTNHHTPYDSTRYLQVGHTRIQQSMLASVRAMVAQGMATRPRTHSCACYKKRTMPKFMNRPASSSDTAASQ